MGLNYNPTIVPDGLVMYFDPANSRSSVGSGNTIYDLTGNSNTCTFSATPTYDVASKGNLLLAGYGTVPHTSTLWGSNEFTLSVWAKKTLDVRGIMISKDTNYIDHSFNGKTMASFYATASYSPRQYLVYGNTSANYNEWRHYTSTYDGTVGSLYENGALIGSTNMSIEILRTTDPLYIGQWNGGFYNFNGKLGTMMTYNRALSAQEVKQNYDATKGRYITQPNIVTSGLIVNYDMSDYRSAPFTGTSIYDLSGFGNTGTLTNGPTFSSINDGAIVFDGTFKYILMSNAIDSNSDLTVSFWNRRFSTGSIHNLLHGVNQSGYFQVRYSASNAVQLVKSNAADMGSFTGYTSTANNDVYLTVRFIKSTSTYDLYINGSYISSITNAQTFVTSGPLLGSGYPGSEHFNGRIYSFTCYNRALSAAEILQNYNATKSRFGL